MPVRMDNSVTHNTKDQSSAGTAHPIHSLLLQRCAVRFRQYTPHDTVYRLLLLDNDHRRYTVRHDVVVFDNAILNESHFEESIISGASFRNYIMQNSIMLFGVADRAEFNDADFPVHSCVPLILQECTRKCIRI